MAESFASFRASSLSVFRFTFRQHQAAPLALATCSSNPCSRARSPTQPAKGGDLDHKSIRLDAVEQSPDLQVGRLDGSKLMLAVLRSVNAGHTLELAEIQCQNLHSRAPSDGLSNWAILRDQPRKHWDYDPAKRPVRG